jgi:hypothetical protein
MQRSNDYALRDFYPKPMAKAQAPTYSFTARDAYKPIASDTFLLDEYGIMQAADQRLKHRIRILKLISRVVAFVMSLITLVPITMTLIKFLLTKDTILVVNGKERTAWANDTMTWYTYMYFGVSLVSCVFNLAIMVAYWRGFKKANDVASIASWWTNTVLVGHVLVWTVSAVLYRYGKEPVGGKFRDLWGW